MNIPESAIEPFGYIGIPQIYLHPDFIKQQVRALFYATDDFGTELIDDIWDRIARFGVMPGKISLHLTPDGDGCLLIARYRFPHKSKYNRMLMTRKFERRPV